MIETLLFENSSIKAIILCSISCNNICIYYSLEKPYFCHQPRGQEKKDEENQMGDKFDGWPKVPGSFRSYIKQATEQ